MLEVEIDVDLDNGDRVQLETAEARVLTHSFVANGKSTDWLNRALHVSTRIYGKGSDERISGYMRTIWKQELCL